ncbi:aminoglycoside phosphotransferase family protein [Lentisphaera profundi]|uniref:Aminoglycoside phosphotransferase family protein n=1 Tax=Lentisphaera profundi TaxID=1658616 RepID=A0ABY7VSD5_9BACT|nr:aminoglycoside phosphotransferase family protein [Lentisphaera profundi]WDE95802.1 aminoglycoside phosphotransferase family protein [Lentisphaera profundi]
MSKYDLKSVMLQFKAPGEFNNGVPYGGGHINDTFKVEMTTGDSTTRYILQRINHLVFKRPDKMMDNIHRVTEHLRNKEHSAFKNPMYLIKTHDDEIFHHDPNGNYWRVYNFIEGALTYDIIESTEQAYQGAKAFGTFQCELSDLPGEDLYETIPDFHNTPKRYKDFEQATIEGITERINFAEDEISQAKKLRKFAPAITDLLAAGSIPHRVTHNDTKLNNVMLENETNIGVCVIDLDTLMTGSALYDFGDFIRTAGRIGAEDEKDLDKISFCHEMYEASLKGYLETAGEALNDVEKENLGISSIVITYEVGLRFLTDYLMGDTYFKTKHETHNLERARVQFKMAREIKKHLSQLNELVK